MLNGWGNTLESLSPILARCIRNNKLILRNKRLSEELHRTLQMICSRRYAGVDKLDFEILSPNGNVLLHMYPKATITPDYRRRYSTLVVLNNMDASNMTLEAEMREKAGCTSSEHEVARLLADGYSTAEIASLREVTLETVRTQLKRVYHKVGVNSQAKLVAWMTERIK